jgi:hypothetical protein
MEDAEPQAPAPRAAANQYTGHAAAPGGWNGAGPVAQPGGGAEVEPATWRPSALTILRTLLLEPFAREFSAPVEPEKVRPCGPACLLAYASSPAWPAAGR